MYKLPLYQHIASTVDARLRCLKTGNDYALTYYYEDMLRWYVDDYLPSGSGFDMGTHLDLEKSTGERLVFRTEFHHMTEGVYDGWTAHEVIVTPSLVHGFNLRITGRDRDNIKDYIAEIFCENLDQDVDSHEVYAKHEEVA